MFFRVISLYSIIFHIYYYLIIELDEGVDKLHSSEYTLRFNEEILKINKINKDIIFSIKNRVFLNC